MNGDSTRELILRLAGGALVSLLLLSVFSGCKKKERAPAGGVVGIQLMARKGLPTLEIAVQVLPPVPASTVAKSVSSVMARAFEGCADKVVKGEKVFPLLLKISVEKRAVTKIVEAKGKLGACLGGRLRGQQLAGWDELKHAVNMAVRPASG